MIREGKPGHPTAFGRVIRLDAVAGGILSRYAGLEGHPGEEAPLPPNLDHHLRVFTRPPRLLAGDRGALASPVVDDEDSVPEGSGSRPAVSVEGHCRGVGKRHQAYFGFNEESVVSIQSACSHLTGGCNALETRAGWYVPCR
jgi:hypothetical protein